MKKYSKKLFVVRKKDRDTSYLLAEEKIENLELEDGDKIAVYRLENTKTVSIKTELK